MYGCDWMANATPTMANIIQEAERRETNDSGKAAIAIRCYNMCPLNWLLWVPDELIIFQSMQTCYWK